MPAGQGKDAERFAAEVEQGRSLGFPEAEFARELEIVAMLRSSGAALAPDPEAKARARRRLMAMMAAEGAGSPTAMEMTLPVSDFPDSATPRSQSATLRSDESPGEITSQIEPVVDEFDEFEDDFDEDYDDYVEDDDRGAVAAPAHGAVRARGGRRRTGRHTLPSRPARSAGSSRPGRRGSLLRRAVMTASAAMLALIAIAGGSVFASRDALPGDGLYGVKRAAESAGLALTLGDAAKASRHLELASTRLSEVEQLVNQKRVAKPDAQLVQSTIEDFDSSTGAGSHLILTEDEAHDPAKLGDLQAWAAEQVSRLSTLRSGMPAAAQEEVDHSIDLLDRLSERAAALEDRAGCTEVTSGESDDIGPLPAESACTTSSNGKNGNSTSPSRRASGGSDADDDSSGSSADSDAPESKGLLPGLLGSQDASSTAGSDTTSTADDESTSASATKTKAPISLPLPLPLLPPITLPPLLPGGQGITIG